jgi:D-glycero-D-manno-heptose 1,7-bisphosphate phosphatase
MWERKFERAIFIDRDGVINYDPGKYTCNIDEFEILENTLTSLKSFWDAGYGLIVITNQAGIAKGLYTESDLRAMHGYLQGECNLRGFAIDAFYHCPHHPDFTGKCLCRKPGSLMLEKGLHHFQLKPENCVMFGDKERDMEAAAAVGIKGIQIPTNKGIHTGMVF